MVYHEDKKLLVPPSLILEAVRKCLGFTWEHQVASYAKKACDCVGLIKLTIFLACLDYPEWKSNYDRVPQGDELIQELEKHLAKVDKQDIRSGDILVFKIKGLVTHVGFYADDSENYGYPTVIHSDQNAKKVVEVSYAPVFQRMLHSVYRFQELDNWYKSLDNRMDSIVVSMNPYDL